MSLYNMLFGENASAPMLLACLGTDRTKVPRYRDCYLDVEKKRIAIHTRTGGGNREYYESLESCKDHYPEYFEDEKEVPTGPWNSDLRSLPGFLYDEDDDFDCTYATFYYSFPKEYETELNALALGLETVAPSEKWQELFRRLSELSKI